MKTYVPLNSIIINKIENLIEKIKSDTQTELGEYPLWSIILQTELLELENDILYDDVLQELTEIRRYKE